MNCSTVDSGFGESDFPFTARGLLANATRCVVDRATGFRCVCVCVPFLALLASSWWSVGTSLAVVSRRIGKWVHESLGRHYHRLHGL